MAKSKLKSKLKSSSILDIAVQYGGEKIRFRLNEELAINENRITEELMEQPSYYGFLKLLMNKLNRVKNDKKISFDSVYSKLFIEYKEDIDPQTHRQYSKEVAKARVLKDKDYKKAAKEYYKAINDFEDIETCVESFDQRSRMIQSVSANVREEHKNS